MPLSLSSVIPNIVVTYFSLRFLDYHQEWELFGLKDHFVSIFSVVNEYVQEDPSNRPPMFSNNSCHRVVTTLFLNKLTPNLKMFREEGLAVCCMIACFSVLVH